MWRLRRVSDGHILRDNESSLWTLVNGCRKKDGGRYTKKEAECMGDGSIVFKMMGVTKKIDAAPIKFSGAENLGHNGSMFVKAYAEQAVAYRIEKYEP